MALGWPSEGSDGVRRSGAAPALVFSGAARCGGEAAASRLAAAAS